MINVDNGRTLGFCRDNKIRYANMVSNGDDFKMIVGSTGCGFHNTASPFMISKTSAVTTHLKTC